MLKTGLLALVLAGAACGGRSAAPERPSHSRVLTYEQIHTYNASNALDLIRALRPVWLQKRGQQSLNFEGDIMVYLDNVRYGTVQVLRSIPTTGITRIEYFDASAATQRWGTGHSHGAIAISTRG
jgi:hypothetical protein